MGEIVYDCCNAWMNASVRARSRARDRAHTQPFVDKTTTMDGSSPIHIANVRNVPVHLLFAIND